MISYKSKSIQFNYTSECHVAAVIVIKAGFQWTDTQVIDCLQQKKVIKLSLNY